MPQVDFQLRITDEQGRSRTVDLDDAEVLIGRGQQCDILLDRSSVSRRHARLTCDDAGQWTVEDMGSSAGTLVNNQPIDRAKLRPGDTITISRFRLELVRPLVPSSDSDDAAGTRVPEHAWADRGSGVFDPGSHDGPTPQLMPDGDSHQISVLTELAPPRLDMAQLAAIQAFGRELLDVEDIDERRQRLCQMVCGERVAARWSMALRLDADEPARPPRPLAMAPDRINRQQDLHLSRSAIRAMQEAQAPVLASNFSAQLGATDAIEMSIVTQGPATAVVVCPLHDRSPVTDLLYVNLPPMYGTGEWLALVTLAVAQFQQAEVAWQARLATRARLAMERDLDHARRIQLSLLPTQTATPGLDVAYRSEPCEHVGGDFLDVVALPNGKTLLIVADVAGHGLPAALATLSIHSAIHTCLRHGDNLLDTATALDTYLHRFLPAERFATFVAVLIDPATGELACVNAGHHAPLIVSATGERELPEGDHLPLGVMPDEFVRQTDHLEEGEWLVLTTDGVTELPVGGEWLGKPRLLDLLREQLATDCTATDCAAAVHEKLSSMRDPGPAPDDLTLLIARRS